MHFSEEPVANLTLPGVLRLGGDLILKNRGLNIVSREPGLGYTVRGSYFLPMMGPLLEVFFTCFPGSPGGVHRSLGLSYWPPIKMRYL